MRSGARSCAPTDESAMAKPLGAQSIVITGGRDVTRELNTVMEPIGTIEANSAQNEEKQV